uniref:DUF834 domain-containing protein n=1 Tax=Oryza sativa subsp. japonica TaxID=39947 RepID=Q8H5V6_ORYSJ|nr:hypothetical protein [Oryza sativa Japonica Group]
MDGLDRLKPIGRLRRVVAGHGHSQGWPDRPQRAAARRRPDNRRRRRCNAALGREAAGEEEKEEGGGSPRGAATEGAAAEGGGGAPWVDDAEGLTAVDGEGEEADEVQHTTTKPTKVTASGDRGYGGDDCRPETVVSVVARERKTVAELGLVATKPAVAAEQCCGGSSDGRRRPALTKAMAAWVGSGGGSPVVDWGSVAVDGVRRGVVMPTAWVARHGDGASSDEVRLEATNGSAASGAR